MSDTVEEIDTLNCWRCLGIRQKPKCDKCSGTGQLYWTGGYAYPYTPEGEKLAREAIRRLTRFMP